jgi:hypothetical protein
MPSADDFDFWLGSWEVRWGPSGEDRGRNVIARSFGGRVVEERFDGRPGVELRGMSVSVFDEHRGLWRQTWVDDAGNYFALEGNLVAGEMTLLTTDHNAAERDAVYRMRFFDIGPDSLTWAWDRSLDGGATFDEVWRLAYERAQVVPGGGAGRAS